MNDRDLADLLGETPPPNAAFRIAVFASAAARARRAEARRRALRRIGLYTAIGLVVPVAGALGATLADVQPLMITIGALGVAVCAAVVAHHAPLVAARFVLGR